MKLFHGQMAHHTTICCTQYCGDGSVMPMTDTPRDDRGRSTWDVCNHWSRVLWLPASVSDFPTTGTQEPAYRDVPEKEEVEVWIDRAIKNANITTESKSLKSTKNTIPHQHKISLQAEALKNLYFEIKKQNYRRRLFYLRHPSTHMNRLAQYAFYLTVRNLGEQPHKVLTTVGVFLYALQPSKLQEFFLGQLSPDPSTPSKWRGKIEEELKDIFIRVDKSDVEPSRYCWLRKTQNTEADHMRGVLEELSRDLGLRDVPWIDFDTAYRNILESQARTLDENFGACSESEGKLKKTLKKLFASEEPPRPHRRCPEVERSAEHLIVCTICGGVPRLLQEMEAAEGTATRTKPVLHVPGCFPLPGETDGAHE